MFSLFTDVLLSNSLVAEKAAVIEKMNLADLSLEALISKGTSLGVEFVSRILLAALIYAVGSWIIRLIKKTFRRLMIRQDVEMSLRTFLQSLIGIGLNFILIVAIIGVLGVEMSSFVALFASAGIAIGMALSGTLQNFANGVLILLLKPYKVGDQIEVQNYKGIVKAIQITNTVITTGDNRSVIVPNGLLLSGTIVNYSQQEHRRVDWTFSIAYGNDYEKAKAVLMDLIQADSRILKEPELPVIYLGNLGQSSVDIIARVWVQSPDYWEVFYSLNEKVYRIFPEKGLSLPFPQLDVHVHQS
ncbi:MAG: mechanosensitive ion channel [Bacteroidales bacterium]|nr:mechanosensitive ion channel [Bacteroidales bacterium]